MINNFDEYFEEKEESYVCKKPVTEVRLPVSFFEKKLAEFILSEINTLAVFTIYFYDSLDIENEKPKALLCKLPMFIRMVPSEILEETIDGEKHFILRFSPGDLFVKSRSLVQHVTNLEKVMDLLFNNFIPDSIDYASIFFLLKDSKNLNKIDLKCSDQLLSLLVAESVRNPNNINEPFRMAFKTNPNLSEKDRKIVRLTDIGRINDSFVGLAGPHPSRSISNAIIKHRNPEIEKEAMESPILSAIK